MSQRAASVSTQTRSVKLFLCGDVMTGRGIDQILPHPGEPKLFEPYVRSALDYVALAGRASGPIAKPVESAYVWGDALATLDRLRPDARIVNLETAVTVADDAWPRKRVHYRMHPGNISCLTAAKIDCCVLANNHVMDWGRGGLVETLDTLHRAGIRTAGAGCDVLEAASPAVIPSPGGGRVLVFSFGSNSAGVPASWAAATGRAGVNCIDNLSARAADEIARQVDALKRDGDIAVVSIHWGSNWGYEVSPAQHAFAHRLIEAGGVDVVHGHSSHHPRAIEIFRGKVILYGCGDSLNDYEGIGGYDSFRPDLCLMYLPTLHVVTGNVVRFDLVPMQIRRFRLQRPHHDDACWLEQMLNREGLRFGTRVERLAEDSFHVR